MLIEHKSRGSIYRCRNMFWCATTFVPNPRYIMGALGAAGRVLQSGVAGLAPLLLLVALATRLGYSVLTISPGLVQ